MQTFLPQVRSDSLPDAIYRTIAFFDVLDFCLTLDEISDRLLGFEATTADISAALGSDKRVECTRGFYHLTGRIELVNRRGQLLENHKSLVARALHLQRLFEFIPFLEGVYLCNTLAMTQSNPGSDIDVLVVVKKGRVFSARLFLVFVTHILRLRRHGRRISGRLCLSFFIDDEHLDFSPLLLQPYDPYFAYWVKLLTPLYLRRDISFPSLNSWMRGYFSHSSNFPLVEKSSGNAVSRFFEFLFSGFLGNLAEKVFGQWQISRARRKYDILGKPEGVFLSSYCLKFHDRDMRKIYRDLFEALIRS
jgi:hypothetical protein